MMTVASDRDDVVIGLGVPQSRFGGDDEADLGRLARRAEDAGFPALWTSEIIRAPMLTPLVTLSYLAGVTRRVALGVGVVLLPLRIPAQLAMQLASLDVVSGGRLIVGLGLGRNDADLYASFGIPTSHRLGRHVGALRIVRGLLESGTAEYPGPEWIVADKFRAVPRSVQRPRPPIWLAAHKEAPLRRAVELADGWIGSGTAPPEEFAQAVEVIHDELAERGREPSSFTIATRLYVALDATKAQRDQVADWYARAYGRRELAAQVVHFGDVDSLLERIAERVRLGARHIVLNPVIDYERHLDVFAADVLGVYPPAASPNARS